MVHDLVGTTNPLVAGIVLARFPIAGGLLGFVAKKRKQFIAISSGGLMSTSAMALVAAAVMLHSLVLLLCATVTAGAGYSLLFSGGLGLVNLVAPIEHRGALISALYLSGYLFMGVVALSIGLMATQYGLGFAVNLGAAFIALMGFVSLYLNWNLDRRTRS